MNRQQNARPNYFDLLGLDPNNEYAEETIRNVLPKKRSDWSKKRNEADARNLALFDDIKKVMTDPSLRRQEAADCKQRRRQAQLERKNKLNGLIDMLLDASGCLEEKSVEALVKAGDFTEAEIQSQIRQRGISIRPDKEQEVIEQEIIIPLSDREINEIEELLKTVGKKDLYDFLEVSSSDKEKEGVESLLAKADEKNRKSSQRAIKTEETRAQGRLSGKCKIIFKDKRKRTAYDAYLTERKFAGFKQDIEILLQSGRIKNKRIDSKFIEKLLSRATEVHALDREEAGDFLARYASQKGYSVILTETGVQPLTFGGSQIHSPKELARAIDKNWKAGRAALRHGDFTNWFTQLGRIDLLDEARKIVKSTQYDRNVGLEVFVQKLDPRLPRPTIAVRPGRLDFGRVEPDSSGHDRRLGKGIRLENGAGRGWLSGAIEVEPTASSWLMVSPNRFKNAQTITVSVKTNELRAGKYKSRVHIRPENDLGAAPVEIPVNVEIAIPFFRFTTGEQARNPKELAGKIDRHWGEGKEALYSGQFTKLLWHWGNSNLERATQTIASSYRGGEQRRNVGLEKFAQTLDPGLPRPTIKAPRKLDFGRIEADSIKTGKLTIKNGANRGWLSGRIRASTNSWLTFKPDYFDNHTREIIVEINTAGLPANKKKTATLFIEPEAGIGARPVQVPVSVQVAFPTLQLLKQIVSTAFKGAGISLILALLVLLIIGYGMTISWIIGAAAAVITWITVVAIAAGIGYGINGEMGGGIGFLLGIYIGSQLGSLAHTWVSGGLGTFLTAPIIFSFLWMFSVFIIIGAVAGAAIGNYRVFARVKQSQVGFQLSAMIVFALLVGLGLTHSFDKMFTYVEVTGETIDETPTLADTSTAEVILSEDFSSAGSDWTTVSDDGAVVEIKDGKLEVWVGKPEWMNWAVHKDDFTNFMLEVEATQIAGTADFKYDILTRYQDENSFYLFSISTRGEYQVQEKKYGTWFTLKEWTSSPAIDTQVGQTNKLKIVALGNRFNFYVNNKRLTTVVNNDLDRGGIALGAGTFAAGGVGVAFDNLVIYE